jgi:NADH:ubiquinone oxidoreductase subunit E
MRGVRGEKMQRMMPELREGGRTGQQTAVSQAIAASLDVDDVQRAQWRRKARGMMGPRTEQERTSALIRILHEVQRRMGFISIEAQREISRVMGIPLSEVHGVVTFYNFFSQSPKGRHTIQICQGTACYVRGGRRIRDKLAKTLEVSPGQTTPDGKFSLESVRCLGCCGLAPVITVDGDVYRRVNPKKVLEVLQHYE